MCLFARPPGFARGLRGNQTLVPGAQHGVNAVRYGVVAIEVIAMGILVWSFIQGISMVVDSSVVGGSAVMLVAVIMLGLLGWRVSFRWKQLRGGRT